MSFERKDGGTAATNNNGYPSTAYGGAVADEVDAKGTLMGASSNKNEYDVMYVVDFGNADAIPGPSESDRQIHTFPAYSAIKSAEVTVLETVSGGSTGFTVGLQEKDGTEIDDDGLVEANTSTAVGSYVDGAGALVGASVGSADGQLIVDGDRTAGKIRIKIKYIKYND